MSTRVVMTHRCTVERDESEPDELGGHSSREWKTHAADQPCHLWAPGARVAVTGEVIASVVDLRLIMPLGTSVATADRIAEVKDRRGATIQAGPFAVDTIVRRKDHLALTLREVG